MLTERLGQLGYPFDDKDRSVSTLGNELRIVRKQMAHMHGFTVEEAFRANDFCVRLLHLLHDEDGLDEARRIRLEALTALAAHEGITKEVAASISPQPVAPIRPIAEVTPGAEVVTPSPAVLERRASIIGDRGLPFEPWSVVPVGDVSVLDDLPKKAAKEKVRAVAVEIATFEGPIHLDRLVQMTAQSFGLQRVTASRERKLSYQVKQAGLFVDADKFVWPRELEADSWTEFRPSDSAAERPFGHISPTEIANAARFIKSMSPDVTAEELNVEVLQTFGRKRRTKQLVAHLNRARKLF